MKTALRCVFAALAVSVWGVSACAETLESAEKDIAEKWDKISALSYVRVSKMVMKGGGQTVISESIDKVELLHEDGKTKMYAEQKSSMDSGRGDKSVLTSSILSDGDFAYTPGSINGKPNFSKWKSDFLLSNSDHAGGRQFFDIQRKYLELSLLPDEIVDGVAAWVIQSKAKDNNPVSLVTKYYFNKQTGILIQALGSTPAISGSDRSSSVEVKIQNVKIDPLLYDKHFIFSPPVGTEIIDMTKQ